MSFLVTILFGLLLVVSGSSTETIDGVDSSVDSVVIDGENPVVIKPKDELETGQDSTEQYEQELFDSEQLKKIVSEEVMKLKRKAEEWSSKSDQTVANIQQFVSIKSNQIKDTVNSNLTESSNQIDGLRDSLEIFALKIRAQLIVESGQLKDKVDRARDEAQAKIRKPCSWKSRKAEKARKRLNRNAEKHKTLIDNFVAETNQLIDNVTLRISETVDQSRSSLHRQAQDFMRQIDETVAWCANELQKWRQSVERDIEATRRILDQREAQFMSGLNDFVTNETRVQFTEWVMASERDFLEAMEAIDDGGSQLKRELELEVLMRNEEEIKSWMENFNNNLRDLEKYFLAELLELEIYIREKIVSMSF